MTERITLRCPKCPRTQTDIRRDTDYPETATVEIICPDCDDGDFHAEVHFDADGQHITRDPKESRRDG